MFLKVKEGADEGEGGVVYGLLQAALSSFTDKYLLC